MSRAWNQELRSRPEAAALIAKVVAQRGGSVEGDLRLLNEQRLPIFSLAAAMAQPDTYKGRFILVRAQVGDVRTAEREAHRVARGARAGLRCQRAAGGLAVA